jgi:hypothetical protein
MIFTPPQAATLDKMGTGRTNGIPVNSSLGNRSIPASFDRFVNTEYEGLSIPKENMNKFS